MGRRRFGDHPDATLFQLVELDVRSDEPWHQKAVDTLQREQPLTDESARALVDEVEQTCGVTRDIQAEDDAELEAEAVLNAGPPKLPLPATPPEPQKLNASTAWAETGLFADAVTDLRELRTKPVARFFGVFPPGELREVADFLIAVADGSKSEAA
jgi:hypothetical protein